MTTHDKGWVAASLASTLAFLLVACGGGTPGDSYAIGTQTPATHATQDRSESEALSTLDASAKPDAQLTAQTLALAETQAQKADSTQSLDSLSPGMIAAKEDYVSGAVTTKATSVSLPAYRFYNTVLAHTFTRSVPPSGTT